MELNVGLIGCGEMGALRAAAAAKAGSLRLAAVSDIDPTRAESVASKHRAAVEGDWRALIRRDEVGAVIVSTPPSLHAEMCVEALKAGKHVLCEKPLGRTPAECEGMVAAARASNRFLATGFNYRFYPSIEKARELMAAGVIGALDHVRAYSGYSAADHSHDWLHDVEMMGGGTLRDNGIHLIDLTRYFLGEIEEVKGFASNSVWRFKGCEDNGFALLRGRAGRVAALHASWTEWRGYRLLVEIYGTRGCIRAWCFPMLTQVIRANERGGRPRKKMYFFPMTHVWERLRSYRWVIVQSLVRELQAFSRAIGGESTALASGQDGLRAVQIAHAICHAPMREPAEALHAAAD